jgi:hypothetical protein
VGVVSVDTVPKESPEKSRFLMGVEAELLPSDEAAGCRTGISSKTCSLSSCLSVVLDLFFGDGVRDFFFGEGVRERVWVGERVFVWRNSMASALEVTRKFLSAKKTGERIFRRSLGTRSNLSNPTKSTSFASSNDCIISKYPTISAATKWNTIMTLVTPSRRVKVLFVDEIGTP